VEELALEIKYDSKEMLSYQFPKGKISKLLGEVALLMWPKYDANSQPSVGSFYR
jgi:hypothetical protein